jgi:hypothetical protein
MLSVLTQEEMAAGLDAVAEELLDEAGIAAPPVDAFAVAAALGVAVVWDADQPVRGRYARLAGHRGGRPQPTISLRPDPRAQREHWALAHEIGEHAAARVFLRWGLDPCETGPPLREEVANRLAGRLLAPTGWLLADGRATGWDLLALRRRYATASHELLARRMLECPPPIIVTIFDAGAISFRRSNVPGRVPPLSRAERACWRFVHRHGRPRRAADTAGRVAGWPVHEEGWKREILRREVDEEASEPPGEGAG